nr:(d)CMP kinase [Bacteroidales bacterium]
RKYVDRRLRELAKDRRVVMDGRDIGTTVFPDAELKIFMVADKKVRAQRRMDELVAKGEDVSFDEILENLEQRDYIDSHRSASPLRQAPDAIVLDNTNMSFEQQMAWLKDLLQSKFSR